MRRPDLRLAVEINRRVRTDDEWFDEPDDLDRVDTALQSVQELVDPVEAAALVAYRLTRAQGFAEGNKRTALLLARWILDNNGLNGRLIIDPDDRKLADLLVRAAFGSGCRGRRAPILRRPRMICQLHLISEIGETSVDEGFVEPCQTGAPGIGAAATPTGHRTDPRLG